MSSDSGDSDIYEVEDILSKRYYSGGIQYYVRWKGYDRDEDSWEPAAQLVGCEEILSNFNFRWTKQFGQGALDYDERVVRSAGKRFKPSAPPSKVAPSPRKSDPQSPSTANSSDDDATNRRKKKQRRVKSISASEEDLSDFIVDDDAEIKMERSKKSSKVKHKRDKESGKSRGDAKEQERRKSQEKSAVSHHGKNKSKVSDDHDSSPATKASTSATGTEHDKLDVMGSKSAKQTMKQDAPKNTVLTQALIETSPINDRRIKRVVGITRKLATQTNQKAHIHYLIEWETPHDPPISLVTTEWVAQNCALLALKFYEAKAQYK